MLEKYGINPEYVLMVMAGMMLVMLITIIVLIVMVNRQNYRYKLFMSGNDGKSLENALSRRVDQLDTLMVEHEMIKAAVDRIDQRMATSLKKVGMLKYNAFEDEGQMSFAICLLDDNDDGFIMNTIHGNDGTYTYMKEIINGNSYTRLSFEEQEALDKAKVVGE